MLKNKITFCFLILKNRFYLFFSVPTLRFDKRALCTVYNMAHKRMHNEEDGKYKDVSIKYFEKNYKTYLPLMINEKYLNHKKRNINTLSNISTNGYSTTIFYSSGRKGKFEKKDKKKKPSEDKKDNKKKDNKEEKVLINLEKHLNGKLTGIFEGSDITMSEDFMDKFHKIGVDIGNDSILYMVNESGHSLDIRKSHFNYISHITLNKKKMKKYIDKSELNKIFDKISKNSYKKTINLDRYIEAVISLNQDIKNIMEFYEQTKIKKLPYDTYVNRKSAFDTLLNKICPKDNKIQLCKNKSKSEYINEDLLKEINGKPIMLAVGKGNGSITVSNVKGASMKGPVKEMINRLSERCLVILTDEFRTSKLCHECHCEMFNPIIKKVNKMLNPENCQCNLCDKINKKNNYKKEAEKIMIERNKNIITEPLELDQSNKKIDLYCKLISHKIHESEKGDNDEEKLYDLSIRLLDNIIGINKYICRGNDHYTAKRKQNNYTTNYKLYACENAELHQNGAYKVWFRDYNAAKNILKVMEDKIKENNLGNFNRDVELREYEYGKVTQREMIILNEEEGRTIHKKKRFSIRFVG